MERQCCFACKGPFHPASGHAWPQGANYCGPCTRKFFAWVKSHTKRRWSGCDFYEEAATSVRAKKDDLGASDTVGSASFVTGLLGVGMIADAFVSMEVSPGDHPALRVGRALRVVAGLALLVAALPKQA
jgi:hypothetical protein